MLYGIIWYYATLCYVVLYYIIPPHSEPRVPFGLRVAGCSRVKAAPIGCVCWRALAWKARIFKLPGSGGNRRATKQIQNKGIYISVVVSLGTSLFLLACAPCCRRQPSL